MRHLHKKTLRRLANSDRQRLVKARIVHSQDDNLEARKRMERQWESSMGLVEHSTPENRQA